MRNKPKRGQSTFHFSFTVADNALWSIKAAGKLKRLLFILMHFSWTARKAKANTNSPGALAPAEQLKLLLQDTRCARAGLQRRLLPGKQEELATSEPIWLRSSALCEKGGCDLPWGWREADLSWPLWSLAFGAAENKSAQLMRKCRVGWCSMGPVFHHIVPSKCCWALCHFFPGTLLLYYRSQKFLFSQWSFEIRISR